MYEYADKVLKYLTRLIYKEFSAFRKTPFDELNVASSVYSLYEALDRHNTEQLRKIAEYYGSGNVEIWLIAFLQGNNPVMKYSYAMEVLRKRDRFIEALLSTKGDVAEIDKAMKQWTQMAGWFAVAVADEAHIQKLRDEGVTEVMWVTVKDERACKECLDRDGKIYDTDAVPPKPHPGCRCMLVEI